MHEAVFWLLFFFLLSVLVVVLSGLGFRYRKQWLVHKERLAALEKGTPIPSGPEPAPWSPRVYLLRGLIWSFSGIAVIVVLLGLSAASTHPLSPTTVEYRARDVSRNLQIPMDQARDLIQRDRAMNAQVMPYGVAVLGVLPLAVGLAYLAFYYTGEAKKKNSLSAPPE